MGDERGVVAHEDTDTKVEHLAHLMFLRNVADYADPTLAELAWVDPDIRRFWVTQVETIAADLGISTTSAHDHQQITEKEQS